MRSILSVLITAAVVTGCVSAHQSATGKLPIGPLAGDSVLSPFYAIPLNA
jgi:hypothetical protein